MATSQTATIPQAQRMFDGGTHKLDVWSIFTYVSLDHLSGSEPLSPSLFRLGLDLDTLSCLLYTLLARA
jgi:hypothetical protein